MPLKLILVCLFSIQICFGQTSITDKNDHYLFNSLRIGISPTYIWEKNEYSTDDYYGELTLNSNFVFQISKRFWLGVQAAPIFTKTRLINTTTSRVNYFAGILGQFDIVNENGLRLMVEASANSSNYCTCGNLTPYTYSNLFTWGLGGGIEFMLNRNKRQNLFLELGFYNYLIINDIPFKYNFTQYIIGLNYAFGKKPD